MAKRLQLRRGTTAEHSSFTGAIGEVTVDTDKDAIILHDGVTAGGVIVGDTTDVVKSNRLGSGSTKYLKGKGDVITETSANFISKVAVDNRYQDIDGVVVDTYGPELVTNGDFTTNITSWTSHSDSGLSHMSGQLKNTISTGDNQGGPYQEITTVVGHVYKLNIYVSPVVGDSAANFELGLFDGGGFNNKQILLVTKTGGTHTMTFVATQTAHRLLLNIYDITGGMSTDTYVLIDNISVREITNIDYSTGNRDNDSSFVPEVTVQDQATDGMVTTADVYAGDYVAVDRGNLFSLGSNISTYNFTVGLDTLDVVSVGAGKSARYSIPVAGGGISVASLNVVSLTDNVHYTSYLLGVVVESINISSTGSHSLSTQEIDEIRITAFQNDSVSITDILIIQKDEIYQATEDTTTGTSLLDTKFRVRDNYGISNQIIALHKMNSTTKAYSIHKEIAFVDFRAGQYRQGMLDNGFTEVETGLYSKGEYTYTLIGVWQTLNKGSFHEDLNKFGTKSFGEPGVADHFWHTSFASDFTTVAGMFGYSDTGYVASTKTSGTDSTGSFHTAGKFYDIVYKDQFTYVPEYANKKSIQEEARQSIDLLSADEGVSELVSITRLSPPGSVLYFFTTTSIYLYRPDSLDFSVGDYVSAVAYDSSFGFISVSGIVTEVISSALRLTIPAVSVTTGVQFDNAMTFSNGSIPHLSQGSHLITDRIGNPTNWEQVALDRLAEGKSLIGQNALLVGQDGSSYVSAGTIDIIFSSKLTANYNALWTNNAGASYTSFNTDSTVSKVLNEFAQRDTTNYIFIAPYTANNNPAIKSDPLPMLTVEPKVTMTNSHSLYKGAAVGNMNGKIQVGNGARSYESKVLENAEIISYTKNMNSTIAVGHRIGEIYYNENGVNPNNVYGGYYEVHTGFGATTSTTAGFAGNSTLIAIEGVLLSAEHQTASLTASTSPSSKFFSGYAYDENGIEYRTYSLQEIVDAGAGVYNSTEFDNLTNGTTLDDVGTTVDTGFFAIPTGFKKGSK